jgi:MYXO-CTERM domain-containing protein
MRVRSEFLVASLFFGVIALPRAALAVDTLTAGDPANSFVISDYLTGLDAVTSFAFLPDGRMVITQKTGNVVLREANGSKSVIGTFAVNTASEQGLLHVIVHPQFATNRLLIFYYSAAANNTLLPGTNDDRQRVSTVPLDTNSKLDMTQEKLLVSGLKGPANHDGGALAIGPDGKLYIGVGDTGCNSNKAPEPVYDPTNFFATCLTNGNGKILRVNLSDGKAPADNPLVGKTVTACGATCGTEVTALPKAAAREEIWAWGFRNPWRFWFDGKTGNLWVGDVGEVTYEEVDVIPPSGAGKHYGWPWREGAKGHPVSACQAITPAGDCVDPQYYCKHGAAAGDIEGNCASVTGGLIVDSCQFPAAFRGLYFFADNATKWLATLEPTADRNGIKPGPRKQFAASAGSPVHLDVGPDGSLYYAVYSTSAGGSYIEKVAPKTPAVCPTLPDAGTRADGSVATDAASPRNDASTGAGGGATGGGGRSSGGGGASGSNAGTSGGGKASSGGPRDASLDGAGATASGGKAHDDSGCGCRVAGAPRGTAPGLLALGALALLGRRRSRRVARS